MADTSGQDRNLPASPRRLQKAREEGQVAPSRDLSHFAAIAAGGAVLVAVAPQLTAWLQRLLAEALHFDHAAVAEPSAMLDKLGAMGLALMAVVVPLGALMAVVAVLGSVLIGGWNWTLQPLAPKFDKLNPLAGLPRLFSKHQLVEALKGCLLALVLGTIGGFYLKGHIATFGGVMALELPAGSQQAGSAGLGRLILLLAS